MSNQLLIIIGSVALAAGIWWLYFIEYRTYRIDHTRQRLFAIRDNLFQQAKDGVVPFDSKAYGLTRTTLNGMIRFTHDLSFLRVLLILFTYKWVDKGARVEQYQHELAEAIMELPKEARKAILETRFNMHVAFTLHIMRSSIVLMLIFEPLRILMQILHQSQQVKRRLQGKKSRDKFIIVDAEANGIGSDLAVAG